MQTKPSNENDTLVKSSIEIHEEEWIPESIPQLTVDMYRKNNIIFVVSTVAGVSEEDLDINVENNTLYIKGIRKTPYNPSEIQIELAECFWGEFYREIPLTETVNVDDVQAVLTSSGILTIEIPVLVMSSKKVSIKKIV
jgi:HSP20 family protein